MIRLRDDEKMKKAMDKKLDGYTEMGQSFAAHGSFMTTEARKFTGPEKNPWIVHLLFKLFIKRLVRNNFDYFAKQWGCTRLVRNNFDYFAKQWGCTRPLDDKPYL